MRCFNYHSFLAIWQTCGAQQNVSHNSCPCHWTSSLSVPGIRSLLCNTMCSCSTCVEKTMVRIVKEGSHYWSMIRFQQQQSFLKIVGMSLRFDLSVFPQCHSMEQQHLRQEYIFAHWAFVVGSALGRFNNSIKKRRLCFDDNSAKLYMTRISAV